MTATVQLARGDLAASKSAYARALELFDRVKDVPWLRLFIGTAMARWIAVTGEGWESILAETEVALREGAAENRWMMAAIRCATAYAAAYLGRSDDALGWLASVIPAIEHASGSTFNYPVLLGQAVLTLEATGRTDHAETIERNLRAKWLAPDFRYPMSDARFYLAMLCGVQARFEEAAEWFARARVIVEEQGALTTRARIDFHEGRMYLRRGAAGDRERATTLLHAALEQCHALGMTGWARMAEEMLVSLNAATNKAPAEAAESADNPSSSHTRATAVHSSFFEFPGFGHGVLSLPGCPTDIVTAFLAEPNQPPDGGCIALIPPPHFVGT